MQIQTYLSNLGLHMYNDKTEPTSVTLHYIFLNRTYLNKYQNREHLSNISSCIKIMVFTCELCSSTFTYKSSLQKHTNSMHKKIRYPCEKCEKSYTSKQNLASHVQIIHETVKHHCNYCNSIFKQKIGLKKHLESKHSPIPIKSN